jgi:hypothetical protein
MKYALMVGFALVASSAPLQAAGPTPAAVAAPAAAAVPPSAALRRVISGEYENRNVPDRALLGTESFRVTAYADGSRCMQIWSNSAARGTQITSHVCVDANFRPTEAQARYWIAGAYRGSGSLRVNGDSLRLVSTAAAADAISESTTTVPARFSVGTHPISGDAWHAAALAADAPASGASATATSFTFNPSGSGKDPLTGALVQIPVERLGEQKTATPVGTFTTRHIRLSGQTNYWVTGEDWIVVRSTAGSSERVLVRYVEGR